MLSDKIKCNISEVNQTKNQYQNGTDPNDSNHKNNHATHANSKPKTPMQEITRNKSNATISISIPPQITLTNPIMLVLQGNILIT